MIKLQCINKKREIWNCKSNLSSFGTMDLRINNKCNESENNYAEIGNNYYSNGLEKDSDEANSFLAGNEEFRIDEIEVF